MASAADLYSLQEIDLALDRSHARLEEIEEKSQETEELKSARSLLEEREQLIRELKARQKDLEADVEQVRGKAAEVEAKLYGGKVTSPKELSDLNDDMKSLKAEASRREDKLLILLVEVDDVEASAREARSAYSQLEADWRGQRDSLMQEKRQLEPQVQALTADRGQKAGDVDRPSVALYELLRERKAGQAVARVERGMCGGCRITLPMSIIQKAKAGGGLVQCVSCERILYVI